jgi:hypothetical protein
MAEFVCISPSYLHSLEQNVRRLVEQGDLVPLLRFGDCGPVDDAYEHLADKWHNSRTKLDESLLQIADTMKLIRESFVNADEQLSLSLNQARSK